MPFRVKAQMFILALISCIFIYFMFRVSYEITVIALVVVFLVTIALSIIIPKRSKKKRN